MQEINSRWGYFKVVLLKRTWEFLATGTVFTFLFVATWWRDNFASDQWKRRLELKGLLPPWHPMSWLCIGLLLVIYLIVSRSYELWKMQSEELASLRTPPAPEFVIDLDERSDEIVGFKLRNTSPHNLYNVGVANIQSRVGEIGWWNNQFPYIEARTGEINLKPSSRIGSTIRFQDVPALLKALQDTPGETNPEIVGKLVVFADDANGNRFRFSTDLQLWNGWTWRVWETERIHAKPKSN
jgi:hypothetical protein